MRNNSNRSTASRTRSKVAAAVCVAASSALLAGTLLTSAPATSGGQRIPVARLAPRSAPAAPGTTGRPAARRGRILGIIPSTHSLSRAVTTAQGTPPLTYHGGPVQHSSKVYAIFWAPKGYYIPPAYQQDVTQFFNDVASQSWKTGNIYAAATQYCEGVAVGATSCSSSSDNFVSYNVTFGASTVATTAYPASGCPNYTLGDGGMSKLCLTDPQIQSEVSSVVSSKGWPTGLATEFFVFTPPHVGECIDSAGISGAGCYDPEFASTGFCAYHSNIAGATLYAFQPWADINGCVYTNTPHGYAYPNDDGSDPLISVVSHEHNETITDPLGTAWYDSSGFENGDECAWLVPTTSYNGIGDYSQTINGDEYMTQAEWSNRANACVVKNTYVQPTASFTSAAATTAHSEKFTSTVSDSDGDASFRYAWDFGDGSTSTVANPTHTFAKAGTFTVQLTVFDGHGDQAHVSKSVSVS